MTTYAVPLDSLHAVVPAPGGFVLRQVDDARRPTRAREAGPYPSRVDALRALLGGDVRWGRWTNLGRAK